MATPPPSTTDGPGASGVAPLDGYTTDGEQLSTSARVIGNAAEDVQGEVEGLGSTALAAADFGTAHTEWHADYAAAIERIGTGAAAMCTTLSSFAGLLGGVGQAYETTDAGAASTVITPGSGM